MKRLVPSLLRALILQAPWAQRRLAPYAGMPVTWDIAGFKGGMTFDAEGLPNEGGEGNGGVHLFLPRDRLAVLAEGMPAIMREVRIEGNAGLASELAYLAQHLKPDLAEFLAPHLGDILAEQTAGHVYRVIDTLPRVGRSLGASLSDYVIYEAGLLVAPDELKRYLDEVDKLRDDLARLTARIERLQRAIKGL